MKNSLVKGLIMGLVAVVSAAFSDMETLNAAYIAIVAFCFTGQYSVKNWLMPSLSDKLSVDIRDIISGMLMAVFMALSVYAGTLLTGVAFTWLAVWKAVSIAVGGYFVKTVPASKGIIKQNR